MQFNHILIKIFTWRGPNSHGTQPPIQSQFHPFIHNSNFSSIEIILTVGLNKTSDKNMLKLTLSQTYDEDEDGD